MKFPKIFLFDSVRAPSRSAWRMMEKRRGFHADMPLSSGKGKLFFRSARALYDLWTACGDRDRTRMGAASDAFGCFMRRVIYPRVRAALHGVRSVACSSDRRGARCAPMRQKSPAPALTAFRCRGFHLLNPSSETAKRPLRCPRCIRSRASRPCTGRSAPNGSACRRSASGKCRAVG